MADRKGALPSGLLDVIDKLQAFETDVWADYYKLVDNLCMERQTHMDHHVNTMTQVNGTTGIARKIRRIIMVMD